MPISAIILSGGRATRMNGVDKGLVILKQNKSLLHQKPLIQHVIERLAPQVDEILINANREITHYQTFGYTVLQDEVEDFLGPLAGFNLGLQHAKHDYLLTVPCDSPLLPLDLAHRLMLALLEHKADIAVASSDGNVHPVFCLCKKNVLPSLAAYLEQGERRVSAWQKNQRYTKVDFSDAIDAFINLNTFEDLTALELKLSDQANL
ncbi:MAG: molybdenum cofactor guanylyltransferase MobA [Methylotenera sp.]|nr:molybdenum cofactor guanylyltransferase MobA [Methylotenera sp.]